MDPAEQYAFQQAINAQGELVGRHDQMLHKVMDSLYGLSTNVSLLSTHYSGNLDTCGRFILQCCLVF